MMHSEFSWIPDNGGDCVTLLQCLVDQVLSSLPCGSQHGDLHPKTLTHRAQSVLINRPQQTLIAHTNCQKVPSLIRMFKCKEMIIMVQ